MIRINAHKASPVSAQLRFVMPAVFWLITASLCFSQRFWVFFEDKPDAVILSKGTEQLARELGITRRALSRRAKVLGSSPVIDRYDLPVSETYIRKLEAMGAEIHVRSKWLNAVSLDASESLMHEIAVLDFVKGIKRVETHSMELPEAGLSLYKIRQPENEHVLEYGLSYTQLNQIRIPEVHDLGLDGEGVLIGLIDSGFDTEEYTVFQQMNIIGMHDFYWNDDNPANEEGDSPDEHDHGTEVLSVIGGFQNGVLIGPAWGASFALAKTEWVPTETRLEEDLWVAGLEWLESLGADIVTSSLGYVEFDDGFTYTYEELNGDVCITTIEADLAAQKGIIVLSSAGNRIPWDYVSSPADGDSVIAVGAVESDGKIWHGSSEGPTADGRIKPDIVAMGGSVYCLRPGLDGSPHYISADGTSLACPLAAGVCALILQAHPELTAMQVRDALRETADRADSPDNRYGWGLIDAYKAVFYHGPFIDDLHLKSNVSGSQNQFLFSVQADTEMDPFSIRLYCSQSSSSGLIPLTVETDGSGQSITCSVWLETLDLDEFSFYISMADFQGITYTCPVQAPEKLYRLSPEGEYSIPITCEVVRNFNLMQNTPNPFTDQTIIRIHLPKKGWVSLMIIDLKGREVITLRNSYTEGFEEPVLWDGCDKTGARVSSGLYLCVLKAQGVQETLKILVTR